MADGKIRREDLFDESALQAINEVAEGMKRLADSFRIALTDAQQLNKEISKSQSMKELNKQTVEATKMQNNLTLTNKKFETQMRAAELQTRKVALAEEKATVAKKKFDDAQVRATKNTNTWGKALGSFAAKFNTIGNVVGGALLKIGSSILKTTREFISFEKIIKSTQGTGDAFAQAIAGAKDATQAFARAVASGDFERFFEKLGDAFKAGKEYAAALDDISDRTRAVDTQSNKTRLAITKLEGVMRNVGVSEEERLAAAKEIRRLTLADLEKRERIAKQSYQAERQRLMDTFKLNEAQAGSILNYVENYDKLTRAQWDSVNAYNNQKKGIEEINKLISISTSEFEKQQLRIARDESVVKLNEMNAALDDQSKSYLKLGELTNNILDPQRDAIAKVVNEWTAAQTEMQMFLNKADRLEGRLGDISEKSKDKVFIDIEKIEADFTDIDTILEVLEGDVEDFYEQINTVTDESYEDQLKIRQKWYDVFRKMRKDEVEEEKNIKEQELKDFEEAEKIKEDLVRQGFELLSMFTDNKLAQQQQAMQREIAMSDGSAEARTAIEQKYHKEMIKLERRQAIISKLSAAFNIIINTAEGVSAALAKANVPLAVMIGAMGQASLIAVALQPIPQYWKGTQSAKEGPAWVGERGREMMIDQYGGMQLTPDRPTLTYLKRGTRVIPAHKTQAMIESVQVSRVPGSKIEQVQDNKELIRAFKEREQPIININSAGITVMTRSATTLTKRIDKYFR